MATYSSNTTIKIESAISASGGSGVIYSAPANSYAIVNASRLSGNTGLQIGGQQVVSNLSAVGNVGYELYVGEGQSVNVTTDSSGTICITGVEFKNTP